MNRFLMTDKTADCEVSFSPVSCIPEGRYAVAAFCGYDRKRVFPIIEKLKESGCRLYFDEIIKDNDDIPRFYSHNIIESVGLLAFVSESALYSRKFRQEVNFALSSEKAVVAVFLEDVIMSAGMEMQFSAVFSIHKNGYTEDEFFNRIKKVNLLDVCRRQ